MTIPLISFASSLCPSRDPKNSATIRETKRSPLTRTVVGLWVLADLCGTIALLVLGILGATHLMAMSAAAAYSMIGASGLSTLLWIAMFVKEKHCPVEKPVPQATS